MTDNKLNKLIKKIKTMVTVSQLEKLLESEVKRVLREKNKIKTGALYNSIRVELYKYNQWYIHAEHYLKYVDADVDIITEAVSKAWIQEFEKFIKGRIEEEMGDETELRNVEKYLNPAFFLIYDD
jgi:hypothetical protein